MRRLELCLAISLLGMTSMLGGAAALGDTLSLYNCSGNNESVHTYNAGDFLYLVPREKRYL